MPGSDRLITVQFYITFDSWYQLSLVRGFVLLVLYYISQRSEGVPVTIIHGKKNTQLSNSERSIQFPESLTRKKNFIKDDNCTFHHRFLPVATYAHTVENYVDSNLKINVKKCKLDKKNVMHVQVSERLDLSWSRNSASLQTGEIRTSMVTTS